MMTDNKNKYIIYTIIALAVFGFLGLVGLTIFFTASLSKDVPLHEWVSASKKFGDDALEMENTVTFQTCPTDDELSAFFKLHRNEFDLMNSMFLEDKLSSLNVLVAYDKDNKMAMYPYVKALKFEDEKGSTGFFSIEKERYDKYRALMKACKVNEIVSLDEDSDIGVGFTMFSESLEPGKDPEDANFFKRKGVSYWKKADFQAYDSTSDIIAEDNYTYGSVQIDSEQHWFIWLWMQSPKKN
ncbi:MAG: hypothetical protein KIT34_13895 [Cyanobacteria bacterium TGS_CYA1]|nr:hypothetical protein [Cyanobacteria bacterium TGS_CYA1]